VTHAIAGRRHWRAVAGALLIVACAAGATSGVNAQGRGRQGGASGPLAQGGVSPAEIQRLFDAYVVMQAQQELQLTDEQYPRFLARVKMLQDLRRRAQNERGRILQQLRRLTQPAEARPDEGQIKAQLKALDELEARTASDVRQAIDGLDEVLDVRQQARFRLFEEQMERRKVELLMRARQGNRLKDQSPPREP
jgi:hypothetical protein